MSAGIEKLRTCIRIWWRIDGVRDRETLHDRPPTPENTAYAQSIADVIAKQIELGVFDRDQMFPNSPKRKEAYFGHYIELWKNTASSTVTPTTWSTYLSKVDNHIAPAWTNKQIAKISAEEVEHWVYKDLMTKLSPKTIRDIIGLFHKIWSYWARHQKNPSDPAKYIKLTSKDNDDIYPFTRNEINKIINLETDKTLRNLWTVMMWSGLSSHELFPLAAEDLNLKRGHANIARGHVKGMLKATKNRRRKRQIELLPIVIKALKNQLEIVKDNPPTSVKVLDRDNHSYKHQKLNFVWYNPNTKSHITYDQIKIYWRKHLSKCNVPYRPLNNGRHTYASQVLSTGAVSAEWLANQLGHSNTEMIHRHYGKFIPEDSKHIINNLSNALGNTQSN